MHPFKKPWFGYVKIFIESRKKKTYEQTHDYFWRHCQSLRISKVQPLKLQR